MDTTDGSAVRRLGVVALLALSAVCSVSAASSRCPCIDARPYLRASPKYQANESVLKMDTGCALRALTASYVFARTDHRTRRDRYPMFFGSDKCDAHDRGRGDCNQTVGCRAGFCDLAWCYVDPDNCAGGNPQVSSALQDCPLHAKYAFMLLVYSRRCFSTT